MSVVLPTGETAPRAVVELTATVGESTAPACRWMDDPDIAAWYVRWVAGRTLLDEILPLITRGNAWAGLPLERIGDAFLSIINDWTGFPQHTAAAVTVRLEKLNAEIVEQHRQQIEEAAALQRPPLRPTRKGNKKRRPKAGRR